MKIVKLEDSGQRTWLIVARILAAIVVVVGISTLLGWQFGIETTKRVYPGWTAMNPATAVSLVVAGLALFALCQGFPGKLWLRVVRILGVFVLAIGLIRLGCYVAGVDWSIDQILYAKWLGPPVEMEANRMAPVTALALLFTGLSLFLLSLSSERWKGLTLALAFAIGLLAALVIVGYLNGIAWLTAIGLHRAVAFHTAICLLALATGITGLAVQKVGLNAPGEAGHTGYAQTIATAGFALAIFLACMIGVASYATLQQFLADSKLTQHTLVVMEAISGVSRELKNAEGAGRGYVITAHESFLEQFQKASTAILTKSEILAGLVADNPRQTRRIAKLGAVLDRKIAAHAQTIELRRSQGVEAASAAVESGVGTRLMEEADVLLKEMIVEEQDLLRIREGLSLRSARSTIVIVVLGSLLTVVLIGVAGYAVHRDSAARRRAEEELLRSRDEFSELYNKAPSGYHSIDADGVIVQINDTELSWFGYERDEIVGKKRMTDLMAPESIPVFAAHFPAFKLSGEVHGLEFRMRRKDGTFFWAMLNAVAITDADGRYLASRSNLYDITERKQALADIEHARAEAVAASLTKSEFLAHMSHEIRTPLNGVVGMIDLLLGTALTPEQARFARLSQTAARSLTTVINDVLDFSKIEAGKLEIVPSDFNLIRAAEDVIEMLAPSAAKKGVELACFVSPDVPVFVRADSDRLRQVLINLINNAVKFTDSGAVVVHVSKDDEQDGQCTVRVTVNDTGVGIHPEQMDRLFKAFSQADPSTTRVYGGTGLGLAISKQLVALMGGEIGVESEPGRGSTFWFTFVCDIRQAPGPTPSIANIRELRVLAVDDSDVHREILLSQIKSWGIEAEGVGNGNDAIRMLDESVSGSKPFRVAIVDSDMPGMDGFTLAQEIRAREKISQTVLMILLTLDHAVDEGTLLRMGFSSQITKPVRQSQLYNAIVNAVAASARKEFAPELESTPGMKNAARTNSENGTRARVLVAEDNEINQIVVGEILRKAGYTFEVVGDGRGAVDSALTGAFDIVLMDCQMPLMDGYEAARTIREREASNPASGRLPIVALTAHAMKGEEAKCLEAGMDAYASKPIDPVQLLRTIERALLGATRMGAPPDERS